MKFQTKSFLEYVCYKLLGHPTKRRGDGQSQWPCPRCNHPRFHTLPVKQGMKNRFKCWSCGFRGDEADLMKELMSGEDWGSRRARLLNWQEEYESKYGGDAAAGTANTPTSPNPFSPPGRPAGSTPTISDEERRRANEAIFDMSGDLWDAVEKIHAVMRRAGVSFESIHKAIIGHYKWIADGDGRHIAECEDPECDTIVCRAERGLPPLTQEEIEHDREEWLRSKQEAEAEWQRQVEEFENEFYGKKKHTKHRNENA